MYQCNLSAVVKFWSKSYVP